MVRQWKQLCHSKVTVPYRLSRIEISAFALDSIFSMFAKQCVEWMKKLFVPKKAMENTIRGRKGAIFICTLHCSYISIYVSLAMPRQSREGT